MSERKHVILTVSPEFHKELKIFVALKGTTMQDYLFDLVKADMNKSIKTTQE